MKPTLPIIFMLVALCACHSKKNIASEELAETNTIATSSSRYQLLRLDSASLDWTIELDSFTLVAEPMPYPYRICRADGDDSTAYSYRLTAAGTTVKGQRTAVSRSVSDTLQQDSIRASTTTQRTDSTTLEKNTATLPISIDILLLGVVALVIFIFILRLKF